MVVTDAIKANFAEHLTKKYPKCEVIPSLYPGDSRCRGKIRVYSGATHVLTVFLHDDHLVVTVYIYEDYTERFPYEEPDSIERALACLDSNLGMYLAQSDQVKNSFDLALAAMCRSKRRGD